MKKKMPAILSHKLVLSFLPKSHIYYPRDVLRLPHLDTKRKALVGQATNLKKTSTLELSRIELL